MTRHLEESQLGQRLHGIVKQWVFTRKFGFLHLENYPDDKIFLSLNQWREDQNPRPGQLVVFFLGRNHKGWSALNCSNDADPPVLVPNQSPKVEPKVVDPWQGLTPQADNMMQMWFQTRRLLGNPSKKVISGPVFDFPLRYRPVAVGTDFLTPGFLELYDELNTVHHALCLRGFSEQEFSLLKDDAMNYTSYFDLVCAENYMDVFDNHDLPKSRISAALADWHRILRLQKNKIAQKSQFQVISIDDLKTLPTFANIIAETERLEGLRKPSSSNTAATRYSEDSLFALLQTYNGFVSEHVMMIPVAKAAWMLFHASKQPLLCKGADNLQALLLTYWVLLQQGFPYAMDHLSLVGEEPHFRLVDANFQRALVQADERALTDCMVQLSISSLNAIEIGYQDAKLEAKAGAEAESAKQKVEKAAATTASPAPPAPASTAAVLSEDKIIQNFRKSQQSEVCFICYDDSVKCTMSTLCCGHPTHVLCVAQWYKTRPNHRMECPKCRQINTEPSINAAQNADIPGSDEEYAYDEDDDEIPPGILQFIESFNRNLFLNHPGNNNNNNSNNNQRGSRLPPTRANDGNSPTRRNIPASQHAPPQPTDDDNESCIRCGHRLRAFRCSNSCCGVCCPLLPGFSRHRCSRHDGDDFEDDEEESYVSSQEDNLCDLCECRIAARDCEAHACGTCCHVLQEGNRTYRCFRHERR